MTASEHRLASALLAEQLAIQSLKLALNLHREARTSLALAIDPFDPPRFEHLSELAADLNAFERALMQAEIDAPDVGAALHRLISAGPAAVEVGV